MTSEQELIAAAKEIIDGGKCMAAGSIDFEVKKPAESVALAVSPLELMSQAIAQGISAEQLQILQEMHFKSLDREAEFEFNQAMTRVQAKIKRIAPDLENPQTRSKYASYAAIDRIIRPIYTAEEFSLSFSEDDCPKPDHIRVVCYVSRGGHTRLYRKDMAADGKGAKGGDVMTKTHAEGAADSYAKRYLVKNIFNIAIGEEDADGNLGLDDVQERVEFIQNCRTFDELKRVFKAHYVAAKEAKDNRAEKQIAAAYEARKREINANH